jgi:uncharacterized NAD(P)/FAD-binding protein YdhS
MDVIDITFLGSGISTTVSLIELFNKILDNVVGSRKVSIVVIEKNHEFWKGIPYGSRSSVNALTITSINDFIYEPERPIFFEWLQANKDDWATFYRERGGITAARWLKNNLPLIEEKKWEAVYVPRFIYGNYLQEKCLRLLKAVEQRQLVDFKLIQAEAIDIEAVGGSLYEIAFEYPDQTSSNITSQKVVIGVGSAPVKKMCEISRDNAIYINDIYEPSVEGNISAIKALLNKGVSDNRNVLIIGSNASSIELLYLLEGMPELRELINKIVIISSSGLLPYHTSTAVLAEHPLPNLDKVKEEGNYTIGTLAAAAESDLKLALTDGANMDYVATIISTTLKMMEILGEDAKKEFYAIYAIQLRDKFRRAGHEYKNIAQSLLDLGEVIILKGRFLNTEFSENGVFMNYQNIETNEQQIFPLSFSTIINCSGSDNLDKSSSRLLYNLINNQICTMNLSGKGIEVNEKFEAAPNLYVMGPLLGGNVNKLIHFWQLENAARLTYLAPHLAKELLNN